MKNRFRWIEFSEFSRRLKSIFAYSRRELRAEKMIRMSEKKLYGVSLKEQQRYIKRDLKRYEKYLAGAIERREDRVLDLTIAATRDFLAALEARQKKRTPDHADPLVRYSTFMERMRLKAFGRKAS